MRKRRDKQVLLNVLGLLQQASRELSEFPVAAKRQHVSLVIDFNGYNTIRLALDSLLRLMYYVIER